jgi:hypothetical protein
MGLLCTGISTWGIVAGIGNMVLAAVHVLLWIFFHDVVGSEVTQGTTPLSSEASNIILFELLAIDHLHCQLQWRRGSAV